MENSFMKVMAQHSDEKLIDILINRNKYQPIAVDAAIKEAINRQMIIDVYDLETKYPLDKMILEQDFLNNQDHINAKNEKKEQAKNDMLYGALWCIGGIVATAAHIGFIFWGAILFGAIQFFKGLSNS